MSAVGLIPDLDSFKVRYVRSPAGVRRYGLPIGSPIVGGKRAKPGGTPGGGGSAPAPKPAGKVRRARTSEGAQRYRLPIGSPIVAGKKNAAKGKDAKAKGKGDVAPKKKADPKVKPKAAPKKPKPKVAPSPKKLTPPGAKIPERNKVVQTTSGGMATVGQLEARRKPMSAGEKQVMGSDPDQLREVLLLALLLSVGVVAGAGPTPGERSQPAASHAVLAADVDPFKVRYVRTPAGVKRYGLPIGSPIVGGKKAKPGGKSSGGGGSTPSKPTSKVRRVRTPAGAKRYGLPIGSPIIAGKKNTAKKGSASGKKDAQAKTPPKAKPAAKPKPPKADATPPPAKPTAPVKPEPKPAAVPKTTPPPAKSDTDPPAAKVATPDAVDVSGWEKAGEQKGSNPGGTYVDGDGVEHYVKQSKSDLHARNEVLASELYKLAGVRHADLQLADVGGGKLGTAAPIVPGATSDLRRRLDDDPAFKEELQDGFATDAWLANWDVAGLEFDNVVSDGDGKPVRIDPGGALLFRAQGAPKGGNFGYEADEWETLRWHDMNPQSAAVFGDMSDEQLKKSSQKVVDITPEQIDKAVDDAGFTGADARVLKDKLRARRLDIAERAGLTPPEQGGEAEVRRIELEEMTADYKKKMTLSEAEKQAIDDYTTDSTSINELVRYGNVSRERDEGHADAIAGLMNRYETPGELLAYRRFLNDADGLLPEGDLTGRMITMPGFSSASVDRPAQGFTDGPNMMEIKIPAGTHGIDVTGTGAGAQGPDGGAEREFMLPHNSRFLVTGQRRKSNGQRVLTVEVYPPLPGEEW